MRRAAAIVASLVLLSGGASAHAQEPPLSASLTDCGTGPDPADRYAVFSGSMPREGAAVMAMRFGLEQRLPGRGWEKVAVDRWDEWVRAARRGIPGFVYRKRLEQLAGPGAYRAVITFRWSEADGSVVRTARRHSGVCRQPDPRPDLHVKRMTFDDAGSAIVVVANRGRGPAGAFAVHAARGDLVKGRALEGLEPGAQAIVTLRVGHCAPGETVTATVDPAGDVGEAREDNNVLAIRCPV